MTEQELVAVNNIMDWFDFTKVLRVMKILRWKWVDAIDDIPSEGEIREFARGLLIRSVEERISIGSGGFQVTNVHNNSFLKLEFIVSEWETTV
jgi:hypothetical protein